MVKEMGRHPAEDASLEDLKGMWRTATEERRLLLVLDNAKDHKQVEPLLPGGRGCAVLVTGGLRFGITTARANWRALWPATAVSALASRRCRCASSGRAIVSVERVNGARTKPARCSPSA